jgi:hypothetical protein
VCTPKSYHEALTSEQAEEWLKAMAEEFNALLKNSMFVLVKLPAGRKVIGAHWLYKVKCRADGSINQLKARWVVKGYSQCYGINFDETFTVIWLENLCLLLAIAAVLNLEVHQMDVDNAFLNTRLSKEIYLKQPEGFVDSNHPNYVCCLLKSLYSLKQALLEWN